MKVYATRFLPGSDLREELQRIVTEQKIQAGFILTCVGSLSKVTLRMAGASAEREDVKVFEGKFEIISAEGTLSPSGMHVHLGLSDKNGNCIGGHLKAGCLIGTTAEIVIGESTKLIFSREPDNQTGFDELVVRK